MLKQEEDEMSVGMQVGICVAIGAVGIILCGIIYYYVRYSKKEYKQLASKE